MQVIYKYPLRVTDFQEFDMPEGAEILSVGVVNDELFLWAKVETDNEPEPRRIRIFGTGNPMRYEHKIKFIGTVLMYKGSLVWHVYENYKEW